MNLTRLFPFLLIVAGALALVFSKRKPVVGLPPGVPTGRVPRSVKLNTPIDRANIKGRNIINGYPRRPGANPGADSFQRDWGGLPALAKTVGHWIPILKNELRARKPPDPFRARSKKMLWLIDDYLARG